MSETLASPRLSRLIARPSSAPSTDPAAAADAAERCELCGAELAEEHRHLLDVNASRLLCACQACALLMDHHAAGGGHYRLIPRAPRRIVDLDLPEYRWQALAVPVDLVFFVASTPREAVIAFYPGAVGATEAQPDPDAWRSVVADNPVLTTLEADIEALLLRRDGEQRQAWLLPIDTCFRLSGRIRSRWRGLSGGSEVWQDIEEFFERLERDARPVDRRGEPAARSTPEASARQETTR